MDRYQVPEWQAAVCRGRPDGTCCTVHLKLKLEALTAQIQKILDENDAKLAAYDEEINKYETSSVKKSIQ